MSLPNKKDKHMTVRIPRGLTEAIENFLESEQARLMGFDSRADVVTQGVRQLLIEFGFFPLKKLANKRGQ